jgi:hypothetical protein
LVLNPQVPQVIVVIIVLKHIVSPYIYSFQSMASPPLIYRYIVSHLVYFVKSPSNVFHIRGKITILPISHSIMFSHEEDGYVYTHIGWD